MRAEKRPNRFYGNGWVGLFKKGKNHPGGSSEADVRLSWQRLPQPGKTLTFNAPGDPGTYEFRMFERDAWWHMLDRTEITVVAPPTPGVMKLAKQIFKVGEKIDLGVALKPGRYYANAWIGMFRPVPDAPGGAKTRSDRLTWQRVNLNTKNLTFTAPATPGRYEFQLFDRDARFYRLDTLSFEVVVPPTPKVMSLAKDTFLIGEKIPLAVKLEPGRHYGNAWIGLYKSEREAPGGAKVERHRITYQRARLNTKTLTFTAPASPGDYEFILFDRDAGFYKLDRLAFKVEVTPTPGVMTMSKKSFVIGEPVTVDVKLKPGRYYGNAWIGLFTRPDDAAGGAGVEHHRLSYQRARLNTKSLKFNGPSTPGKYSFRLYDRDAHYFLLDTIDFDVTVPPTPDVLSLNKTDYVTGESIRLGVALKPGRYYGNTWIGLFKKATESDAGARIAGHRITYQRARLNTKELNWKAPGEPGRYDFRLYDRDAGHYEIASTSFEVRSTPQSGLLSVQKSRYRAGELVRVKVRMPENRTLGHSYVELARSGHSVTGGALAGEHRIRTFRVGKNVPALAFQAPTAPGPYELRFYDRGANLYILDIKTFSVQASPPDGIQRRPVRFTPMPGQRSAALSPAATEGGGTGRDRSGGRSGSEDDGIPGRPVRPDGTPTDQPDTGDSSGTGGADGDDRSGDNEQASRPQLKFLAVGSNGLADIKSIKRGQPFIIEAKYAKAPDKATVTARLSFGKGGNQAIVLHRADDNGVYRSGVIRLPSGGRN